jgi:hypothetical protein
MTRLFRSEIQCVLCGTTSMHTVIMSTHAIGLPDLDLRPPEAHRSTMECWAQRCPQCGYCAPLLDRELPGAREALSTEAYRRQLTEADRPELANTFACLALIHAAGGNRSQAGQAMLYAAWVCDDDACSAGSRACREAAIEYLRGQSGLSEPDLTMLLDLLRRLGRFAEARRLLQRVPRERCHEITQAILSFQERLIEQADQDRHNLKEAEKAE